MRALCRKRLQSAVSVAGDPESDSQKRRTRRKLEIPTTRLATELKHFKATFGLDHNLLFYSTSCCNFGSQSFGVLRRLDLLRDSGYAVEGDPIPEFGSKRLAIEDRLKSFLGLSGCEATGVAFGPGASYWTSIFSQNEFKGKRIAFLEDEFIATKLAFRYGQGNEASVTRLPKLDPGCSIDFPTQFASNLSQACRYPDHGTLAPVAAIVPDLLVMSIVNSMNQWCLTSDELLSILAQLFDLQPALTVILDGTQAFGNIDLCPYGEVIFGVNGSRPWRNAICVVGSLVKGLRGGDGGSGFLIARQHFLHAHGCGRYSTCFGWTAHLETLKSNELSGTSPMFPMDGPTPPAFNWLCWYQVSKIFYPNVETQKLWVHGMHNRFFGTIEELLKEEKQKQGNRCINSMFCRGNVIDSLRRKKSSRSQWSNTLVFPVPHDSGVEPDMLLIHLAEMGFTGIDYKIATVSGGRRQYQIRVGFGMQNLPHSVESLACACLKYELRAHKQSQI